MRRLAVLIAIMLAPAVAHAEDYICRTAARSCAFSYAGTVRDGTACHCATQNGPVGGYSMPDPTSTTPVIRPMMPQPIAAPSSNAECFRGIGNCPDN